MKLIWCKIEGYCEGSFHTNYELTTFMIPGDHFKWFIDNKQGEAVAFGYGLTNRLAKQAAEATLQQHIGQGENYEQINYYNYSFDGNDDGSMRG
jgi:hypothetical protein